MLKKTLFLIACYQAIITGAIAHDKNTIGYSKKDVVGEFEGLTALAVSETCAYVCNLVGKSVQVIDVKSNEVIATIRDQSMTAPFKIAIINGYAYVCNLKNDTISIIDTTSNTFVKTISKGLQGSNSIAVASVLGTPLACVVDVGVLQILDLTVPTDPRVIQTCVDDHINGLGVVIGEAPDYSIYLTATADFNQGQILAYSQIGGMYSTAPIQMNSPEVEGGRWLSAITTVSGSYAYVCDSLNDLVQVYDLEKQCYLTSVSGFSTPVALANSGAHVYVCNFAESSLANDAYQGHPGLSKRGMTVTIIDAANHTIKGALGGFYSPQAVAGVPGSPEILYIVDASDGGLVCPSSRGSVSQTSMFNSSAMYSSHGVF